MHFRARTVFPSLRCISFSTVNTECRQVYPKRSHIRRIDPASIQWFPGHMRKGMNLMNMKLSGVDVIVEVHDARVPFSGRSEFIQKFGLIRPHIILLNKTDLAEPIQNKQIYKSRILEFSKLKNETPLEIHFTQLNSPERQKHLLKRLINSLAQNVNTQFSTNLGSSALHSAVTALAVGIPNSGKSTLINALRCIGHGGPGGAVRIGRNAGQTRSVTQPITIYRTNVGRLASQEDADDDQLTNSTNFRIQMLDTPGILEPRARSLCEQLSLCVCGAVDWDAVNKEILVDYLLFYLNNRGKLDYVSILNLPGPTDNVVELLIRVCAQNQFFLPKSNNHRLSWQPNTIESLDSVHSDMFSSKLLPDMNRAALHILQLFNKGSLGRVTFYPEDEAEASNYFVAID